MPGALVLGTRTTVRRQPSRPRTRSRRERMPPPRCVEPPHPRRRRGAAGVSCAGWEARRARDRVDNRPAAPGSMLRRNNPWRRGALCCSPAARGALVTRVGWPGDAVAAGARPREWRPDLREADKTGVSSIAGGTHGAPAGSPPLLRDRSDGRRLPSSSQGRDDGQHGKSAVHSAPPILRAVPEQQRIDGLSRSAGSGTVNWRSVEKDEPDIHVGNASLAQARRRSSRRRGRVDRAGSASRIGGA